MTAGALLAVCTIVALAAFAQTVAGFGFSLLAVPPLGLVIDPKDAIAVALVLLVVNSALLAWGERTHIDWLSVRLLLVGAVPGLPLGMLLLAAASADALRVALAVAVLVSVAILASGATLRTEHTAVELGAGFATGLLTTSLTTNGPPTVLALQARRLEPHRFRPSTSAVLGLTSAVGVALFALGGRLSGEVNLAAVASMPGLAAGWSVGTRLRHRVPPAGFRYVVLGLLVAAAVASLMAAIR